MNIHVTNRKYLYVYSSLTLGTNDQSLVATSSGSVAATNTLTIKLVDDNSTQLILVAGTVEFLYYLKRGGEKMNS